MTVLKKTGWVRRLRLVLWAVLLGALFPMTTLSSMKSDFGMMDETPVEVNGDQVEFSMAEKKVSAVGHVVVTKGDVTLTCDRLDFFRETNLAVADGNVILERPDGRIMGEKVTFDFGTMTGDFTRARFAFSPMYGGGTSLSKVGDNHLVLDRGYLTTCDHDIPHFRLATRKIDVYPGDKAVARNVRLVAGKVPVAFIPRYSQDLRGLEPTIIYTPGYDKDWGAFLLSKWRHRWNDDVKTTLHLDYRERLDVGSGLDVEYQTEDYGNGMLRTYYTNERNTGKSHHFWEDRDFATPEHERFKVEWRHKWNIDNSTRAIWQYYKLSDADFLKDYFRREYHDETNPPTYFLLTKGFSSGTLSLEVDDRVNRFESMVERLPEITYDMPDREILESGVYFQNTASFSNLSKKDASPTEHRLETMRGDLNSRLSYPAKVSFVEIKPFVGSRETYYSKTQDRGDYGVTREVFNTGADLSTKFYRIYEAQIQKWGLNIDRLRHVITPTIAYLYQHDPTVTASKLDQFDAVDALHREHVINFGLENKLQTKRNQKSVDLFRLLLGTDFRLKEDPGKGGFNTITSDIEIKPYSWWTLYADSAYDTTRDKLTTANFDLYINGKDEKWYWNIGKRFNVDVDDQITSEWGYRLNQKWNVRVYERFDTDRGLLKEQEYTLRRDLHEWTMDMSFNQTRGEGSEVWLVFTLKAFPDMALDFGSSYNRRKTGAQD